MSSAPCPQVDIDELLSYFEPAPVAREEHLCARCGERYSMDAECGEPTLFCNNCAHCLAEEIVPAILGELGSLRTSAAAPPPMFAIGSPKWPGLSKITEEAGEVQQVIGKLMGTGGAVEHWDGSNLRTRLIEEVGDTLAACDFVVALNLDREAVEIRRAQKLELFHKWHRESQP